MDNNDGRRSIGALLRDLADGSATLVRQEARIARLEFSELGSALARGTVLASAGAVFALLGVLALIAGLVMLAGDQWLRDRHWLAALIAMLIAGAAAAVFARRGVRALSPRSLALDQTVATLREDREWLKRQLTSGAKSR